MAFDHSGTDRASPQDDPPHPRYAAPVRIVADAFNSGLPARDLFLAPGHRVYVDGVLIPIRLLINGATVQRTRAYGTRYFRIELERHDILLAEGLPVETFLTPDEAVSRTGAADRRPGEGVVCARTVAGGNLLREIRHSIDLRAAGLFFSSRKIQQPRQYGPRLQDAAD